MRKAVLFLCASCCLLGATSPYQRLTDATKLWAYVKYCHPLVTSDQIDWDAAFANAAPKILKAETDADYIAAVSEMLAVLKDPSTGIAPPLKARFKPVFVEEAEVTVVRFEEANFSEMLTHRNTLARKRLSGTVLFDLRGVGMARYVLPSLFPLRKDSVGPAQMLRVHSGYANDANNGSGGYRSYWETQDGARVRGSANGIERLVFLVNRDSAIPDIALAVQESGAGAIISEGPIGEDQFDFTRTKPAGGRLSVRVRTSIPVYPDGTTGVSANVVLDTTGDASYKTALELAKSGKWPAAMARQKLRLPPARFMENQYRDQPYPDEPYRLLAAARIWAVFEYFHAYRHLYDEDWDAVLTEFFPRMAAARNAVEYHETVAEMVTHVHDTHCIVSSPTLTARGMTPPPIELRWIEERPVVTRVFDQALDVRPGDVLTKIDGEPYATRWEQVKKLYTASTPQSLGRSIGSVLSGPRDSSVRATFQRGSEAPQHDVTLTRTGTTQFHPARPGAAFRLLSPKIGYADLEKLTNDQVAAMFQMFRETDAIILDMRGYPQGTAWTIAPMLTEHNGVIAASFRRNLVRPDSGGDLGIMTLSFEQRIPSRPENVPRYKGKTVMLIDERAISQSEHSGLFYRAANGTKFIGTATVGANGDVTYFHAPGGIRISFSGHDVRWPDGKQLQRVGLIPDIEVHPTVEGIRAGRDEILERAIQYIETGR